MAEKSEKMDAIHPTATSTGSDHSPKAGEVVDMKDDDFEVFKKNVDGVEFRLVSWQRASVIFLKILFATGVLSIPTAMYSLGSVGGSLSVIGWGALNTYTAIVQGNFRNRHAHCHSIADMAFVIGGVTLREIVGFLFVVAYILCTGSGILGVSIGINALGEHPGCTVWWSFLAMAFVIGTASIRKFQKIGWLSWAGFISIYAAVFIVVIAVTTRDRPAAAPQTGDYDLGWRAIGSPGFAEGMTASATIFISSAGTSAFLPVISEMKNPKDYNRAVYTAMSVVQTSYLTFALVVYRWCGQYVGNPSLGSAGPTIKKVSYGVGLIGLVASATLYLHVAAKYVFVRVLRDSKHLQQNTLVHWGTWLGCTISMGALAFILASAIPIFNYLIALTGTVCFAPLALSLPGALWLYDFWSYKTGTMWQKAQWVFHIFLVLLGFFFLAGGTYGVVEQIKAAYDSGMIGSAFSCADNSNTVGA